MEKNIRLALWLGEGKMKRERAEKLLPIIQAYAEGKELQYRYINHEEWLDLGCCEAYFELLSPIREYRIKPEEDTGITSVEELKEAISSKRQEISSRGENASLFLYITISKNMLKAIEERYSCQFRTDKGSVNTFFGIPFVVGDTTKVEIKDRFIEKKEHKECDSYRPFKSCNELVYYWEREKVGYSVNPLQMIDIWVKHKIDGRRRVIVGFGDNFVEVGVKAKPVTLERLFEMYTFLDGSPCGVVANENK